MTIVEFAVLLLIAAICGGIAQAIAGVSRGGLLVSVAIGFIGALLGMWIQRATGLPELLLLRVGESAFPVIWSIIGGALFVTLLGFLTRRRNLLTW